MLPVSALNLLQSITLEANVSRLLAERAIAGFQVRKQHIGEALAKNPILITALNARIGYEKGAAIAKQAYKEGRPVIDVAADMPGLPRAERAKLPAPARHPPGRVGHRRRRPATRP